jgi:hypothetical protein
MYEKIRPVSTPRAVVFNAVCLTNPAVLIVGVIFIVLFCIAFGGLVSLAASIWGINAQAQVNSYRTWIAQVKGQDNFNYEINISYPYPQNTYRINIDADGDLYELASHRTNLDVRYFAAMPQYPHLEASNDTVGFITIFLFLLITVPSIWQIIRSRNLIKNGVPLTGKVIKVWSWKNLIHRKISCDFEGRGFTAILEGSSEDTGHVLLFADKNEPENIICYGKYIQWKIRGL